MATTTNYGWTTPDDTALVKDGAAAIRTLGSSIDTSLNTALGTKKAGLVLLNTTSFSAVASQNLTSIFSSTYDNYLIVISELAGSTGTTLRARLGASGTPNTTSTYQYGGWTIDWTASTGAASGQNQSSFFINNVSGTANEKNGIEINVFQPNKATFTTVNYQGYDYRNQRLHVASGGHSTASAMTDFQIFPDTGTITGSVSVYGYNK
jgi:hypothetical protein